MKVCKKCELPRNEDEYRSGHHVCKICTAKKHQAWVKKHREDWYEYLQENGIKFECMHCNIGSIDTYEMLDFHHLQPKENRTKAISKQIARTSILSEKGKILLKEIKENCVLLCANCHRLVHAKKICLNLP